MTVPELLLHAVAGFVHGLAESGARFLSGTLKIKPRRVLRDRHAPRHSQLQINRLDHPPHASGWYLSLRKDYLADTAAGYRIVTTYGPFLAKGAVGLVREATLNMILSSHLHLGQDADAERLGEEMIGAIRDPEVWVLVRSNLAIAKSRLKHRAAAEQLLESILHRHPTNLHALFNLLCFGSSSGDEAACWVRGRALVTVFPEAGDPDSELGRLLQNEEDLAFFRSTAAFRDLLPKLRRSNVLEALAARWYAQPAFRFAVLLAIAVGLLLIFAYSGLAEAALVSG